jgi:5-methylcytosine-specific restriction endonuclease McrA
MVPMAPAPLGNSSRRVQLPKSTQIQIFQRDGWLCRWCGKPVIFAPSMKYLELELRSSGITSPLAYYHAHWTRATAPLLDELGAVLDHIDAFARKGPCHPDNLVTACAKCNGRKGAITQETWAKRDIRKSIKGRYGEPQAWDGLSSLFVMLATRDVTALTAGERSWLKALECTFSGPA